MTPSEEVGDFYADADSLFVRAYDAFYDDPPAYLAGDIAYYRTLAARTGGGVLELGCGTGRVAIPLAAAGYRVVGVDLSEGMLQHARQRAASLPEGRRQLVSFRQGNMTDLDLSQRFALITSPFRAFQHLLTPQDQLRALAVMRRHLEDDGLLSLHLFDPRLDLLTEDAARHAGHAGTSPVTGHRFEAEIETCRFDFLAQTRHDLWRYREYAADGDLRAEARREMVLRWTYRHELHHLLARAGFRVDAEYSDFAGTPPRYGGELIVEARPV